uniref:Uncharacterized protein n=1 Tax=Naja naja TaxID=35670 RepID=A0A8C6XS94_NAJNA
MVEGLLLEQGVGLEDLRGPIQLCYCGALAETSGSLGTLAGVNPQPINQIPPSEVTIQPPSVVVTIPGPILSASCEPVAVGGNTPCAPGGIGRLGAGYLGGRLGRLGSRGGIIYGRSLLLVAVEIFSMEPGWGRGRKRRVAKVPLLMNKPWWVKQIIGWVCPLHSPI